MLEEFFERGSVFAHFLAEEAERLGVGADEVAIELEDNRDVQRSGGG